MRRSLPPSRKHHAAIADSGHAASSRSPNRPSGFGDWSAISTLASTERRAKRILLAAENCLAAIEGADQGTGPANLPISLRATYWRRACGPIADRINSERVRQRALCLHNWGGHGRDFAVRGPPMTRLLGFAHFRLVHGAMLCPTVAPSFLGFRHVGATFTASDKSIDANSADCHRFRGRCARGRRLIVPQTGAGNRKGEITPYLWRASGGEIREIRRV